MDRNRHMATRTAHPVDNVHPVSRTSNFHYAAMRRAEQAARGLSVQYSTRRFTAAFDPDTTPDSLAELAATRDSYYLLAAAHRQAAHRLERGQRMRYRLSVLTYPAYRVLNRVRRFRNERQQGDA